jgi:hypothetical protein
VDGLQDHLESQVAELRVAGLDEEEAFLIAVKRLGDLDSLSREYAREYSERLWKRLVVAPRAGESGAQWTKEALVAVGLAVAAGVAIKVPELFGMKLHDLDSGNGIDEHPSFYARNLSLFVLPFLAAFFAWKRGLEPAGRLWLAAPFVVAALVVNLLPFTPLGHTEMLAAMHLPVALWLTVGIAYAGGRWRDHQQRMNYVRFSGEWYAISARDPQQEPGLFDGLQLLLVVCALLVDALALWAIVARISEFGFSPNKVAALGENLILVVNLTWSAVLYAKFLLRQVGFTPLERWQTAYLPVYAIWALVVVVIFPLVFAFR